MRCSMSLNGKSPSNRQPYSSRGEFGSGKTSFMQCLSSRTNLHLKIDRIAFSEPGVELLKDMYAQLIDGSPPHDYSKLNRELRRMIHDSRQMLPLITIDADMADFSSLEACLRSSLHFFESLPALIIMPSILNNNLLFPNNCFSVLNYERCLNWGKMASKPWSKANCKSGYATISNVKRRCKPTPPIESEWPPRCSDSSSSERCFRNAQCLKQSFVSAYV